MNIAIDVMGGDYAPEAVIDGIIQAIPSLTNKEVILAIGPKEIIDQLLAERNCTSEQIRVIHAEEVIEMGEQNSIPAESIIASKVDILIYDGFGHTFQHEEQLEKIGIVCLANYDWREIHPLGKAEWIKLYGYLTGKEKAAIDYFNEVEKEYNELKKIALNVVSKPSLFSGNMVGDIWNSPAGESFNAVLFKDANCKYVYANSKGTGSISKSFEQTLVDNRATDFWFNPGVVSKSELLKAHPKFSNFDAVKKNKVYSYSFSGNEFWERSAIEPHHVLSDLIHILHPEIENKRNYYFYRQLK